MRKLVISLAAAGTALALATPASAQYSPAYSPTPQRYGYGYNHWGHVRALQERIDRVQSNINRLDRRDAIRDRIADRLRDEARSVEKRLRRSARYGFTPHEANYVERQVFSLEQHVRMALGNRWRNDWGFNGYNGYAYGNYDPSYADRDRDGRIDRWEDDRGRDRDD